MLLIMTSLSCEKSPSHGVEAIVEIALEKGDGIESTNGAVVYICYRDYIGQIQRKTAEVNRSENSYITTLPSGSSPAIPFIEVLLNGNHYGYSIGETCFNAAQSYQYYLILSKNGLQQQNSDIEVSDWSTVNVSITFD